MPGDNQPSLFFKLSPINQWNKMQVNSKATVMISTLIDEGVHERIILPEFPYLTDENGGMRENRMLELML